MATTQSKTRQKTPPEISVQTAVERAVLYFRSLVLGFNKVAQKPITNVTLEEVERSPDQKFWLVTLGFNEPRESPQLPKFLQVPVRTLKVFKVNAQSGEVVAMKIREDT